MHINFDAVYQGGSKFALETRSAYLLNEIFGSFFAILDQWNCTFLQLRKRNRLNRII